MGWMGREVEAPLVLWVPGGFVAGVCGWRAVCGCVWWRWVRMCGNEGGEAGE